MACLKQASSCQWSTRKNIQSNIQSGMSSRVCEIACIHTRTLAPQYTKYYIRNSIVEVTVCQFHDLKRANNIY